jgi:hypothetical protein
MVLGSNGGSLVIPSMGIMVIDHIKLQNCLSLLIF